MQITFFLVINIVLLLLLNNSIKEFDRELKNMMLINKIARAYSITLK